MCTIFETCTSHALFFSIFVYFISADDIIFSMMLKKKFLHIAPAVSKSALCSHRPKIRFAEGGKFCAHSSLKTFFHFDTDDDDIIRSFGVVVLCCFIFDGIIFVIARFPYEFLISVRSFDKHVVCLEITIQQHTHTDTQYTF